MLAKIKKVKIIKNEEYLFSSTKKQKNPEYLSFNRLINTYLHFLIGYFACCLNNFHSKSISCCE